MIFKKRYYIMTPSYLKILRLLFIAFILFSFSFESAPKGPKTKKSTTPVYKYNPDARMLYLKTSIKEKYVLKYLFPIAISEFKWNGDLKTCNAGSMDSTQLNSVLQRINFFRALDSLPPVTFGAQENALAQKAAALMKANGELSHNPPKTWKCYSEEAATGASNSNLGESYEGDPSVFIRNFIRDDGTSNGSVGHRRWILNSAAGKFGFGSTGDYGALWVINKQETKGKIPFSITWPCKGYIPAPLVFDRWSCAIPDADFSHTSVQMTNQNTGQRVSVSLEPLKYGYGDNTLVWIPVKTDILSSEDITYHVKLYNVMLHGKKINYEYDVTIFQP